MDSNERAESFKRERSELSLWVPGPEGLRPG
jgi:hypothetical protein